MWNVHSKRRHIFKRLVVVLDAVAKLMSESFGHTPCVVQTDLTSEAVAQAVFDVQCRSEAEQHMLLGVSFMLPPRLRLHVTFMFHSLLRCVFIYE